MSTPSQPPPPPSEPPSEATPSAPNPGGPTPSGGGSGAKVWKVATALTLVAGLILTGVVYLLMDRQADDLRAELDAARDELAAAPDDASGGGLEDMLGDLGGLEGLLGEDGSGLDDLLGGLGGADGLGDLGGLGDLDPILFQCLGTGALGLGDDGGSIPDGDVETQVAAIQQIVAEERGLPATENVDIEFVSIDEVQRRAVELSSEDLDAEQAAVDSRLLAALGAVEPGTDLVQSQLDALDAGVGGFYSPETQELVIGSEQMDGLGAFITAHELVHAQADAALGLPDQEAIATEAGSDAAYAALNAVEGDASLYSQQFIGSHLPLDQLLSLQTQSEQTTDGLGELPHFVSRQLEFPYVEGLTFSCDLFLDGGWDAIDATYATLPTTTAQILFPDRYRDGEGAADVRAPAGPAGWDVLRTDTFGAADLLFLLEAPGDEPDAALSDPLDRIAAWAGGEVSVWGQGEQSALALVLADRGDATPLCDTITDFYAAAFPDATASGSPDQPGGSTFAGPEQSAVVTCSGAEVSLGIGPDADTAAAAIS